MQPLNKKYRSIGKALDYELRVQSAHKIIDIPIWNAMTPDVQEEWSNLFNEGHIYKVEKEENEK